ncbi:MAG: hypothetical protein IPK26_05970 [Planctomycetes bacterium]|nr:hypothetical protein [Planctomycetota bacterium]
MRIPRSWLPAAALLIAACGGPASTPTPAADTGDAAYDRCAVLAPLQEPLPAARPGDWLAQHVEPGQTYAAYRAEDPITPDEQRRTLYVLPIGEFSPAQQRVLDATLAVLPSWFGLPVTTLPALPRSEVPADAQRQSPQGGWRQLRSTWLLHEALRPRLPDDAACLIGFCADDLWPGPGWNFVFGEASLRHRVGVWSLYRNGDPSAGDRAFTLCLERTLKTATHEIGHMFSLRHCTAFLCNMNGANHQDESDRQPLWLCRECLPKLLWACRLDGAARARKLAQYCRERGLAAASHYQREAELLR